MTEREIIDKVAKRIAGRPVNWELYSEKVKVVNKQTGHIMLSSFVGGLSCCHWSGQTGGSVCHLNGTPFTHEEAMAVFDEANLVQKVLGTHEYLRLRNRNK